MDKKNKKILILNAHPYAESFCDALAQKYYEGALDGGQDVKISNLRDLNFDPNLHGGYVVVTELEDDLKTQQELIKWSEHLVIVTPLWWASVPALLKGYIDRVFLPGFAFKYSDKSPLPKKLLEGKSATVIYTQGSPFFYSFLFVRDSFWHMLKVGLLGFCGFKPVKRVVIASVKSLTSEKRVEWLNKIYEKGRQGF